LGGLAVISGDAKALCITYPDVVLRVGVALVSGALEPRHRGRVVSHDAFAFGVEVAESVLSNGVSLFGECAPNLDRLYVIAPSIGGEAVLERALRGSRLDRDRDSDRAKECACHELH